MTLTGVSRRDGTRLNAGCGALNHWLKDDYGLILVTGNSELDYISTSLVSFMTLGPSLRCSPSSTASPPLLRVPVYTDTGVRYLSTAGCTLEDSNVGLNHLYCHGGTVPDSMQGVVL